MSIREQIVSAKNKYLPLYYLWVEWIRLRGFVSIRVRSDRECIDILYYDKCNRFPNLEEPTRFSEKMQWLKLHYRNKSMPECVDKEMVRDYVRKNGHGDILNEVYGVYRSFNEINVSELPKCFALKATHGSGWNLIVKDQKKVNWFFWSRIIKSWLKQSIFWNGREWVYKDLEPKIICEKYLLGQSDNVVDYKFHCFNGTPKFVQANSGRGTDSHAQNFYDLNWTILPFGKDLKPRPDIQIRQPFSFEKMLNISSTLSKQFPYVRVDFYEESGEVVFGELTFFPASGMPDFMPDEYDGIVGDMLDIQHLMSQEV